MHRNDHPTAINGLHFKGDPALNTPATVVTHELMNALQEETAHVVEYFLGPLDKADNQQLRKAIQKAITGELTDGDYVSRPELGNAAFKDTGPGADQVAAGDHGHLDLVRGDQLGNAAYKDVGGGANQVAAGDHTHAALAEGMLPIGVPIPWPTHAPPQGFVLMVGQVFDTGVFPLLAQMYPSGVLPDMRAESIRGVDGGRGVDPGRGLLTAQLDAMQNITGSYSHGSNTGTGSNPVGAFAGYGGPIAYGGGGVIAGNSTMTFDASRVVRTSTETRGRNVAFYWICRAY